MKFLILFLSTLVGLANGAEPRFTAQEIDTELEIGYGLALADVNGDGHHDILVADKKVIAWYENPNWTKHIIAESLTEKDNVCIAARDIDGDGKCEVAVGAEWNPGDTEGSGAVFYLVPPADRTQRWEPVRLTHEPTTHRMKWVRNRAGRYDLIVVPLHGRGNKAGVGEGVKVLAYHKPEDPHQPWNTSLVQGTMHSTHNFDIIPAAEGDAEELLLAGREGIVRLIQTDAGWREHWISRHPADSDTLKGAGEVRYGAFGGGQPYVATIEPMHGHQLVLYTPPPDGPKNAEWSRRV
ncbi:MAG: VCBS repeat-containing protein, partial [Verrucomicrobiales bacterium]|nr:VCBS repeat-containing protein [Verrucomicrobiales bacterium]